MPGPSFSLPAKACQTGSKLNAVPGSVCAGCYARKGFYRMPGVAAAQANRLRLLLACEHDPDKRAAWVTEMTANILRSKCKHFRWHDSGDLQGVWHAEMLAEVSQRCPGVRFWIPTKEYKYAAAVNWPENVAVRRSSFMVGVGPKNAPGLWSMVVDGPVPDGVHPCGAGDNGGKCGDCRKCWDGTVKVVAYRKH
jgi:hypothetical protein